MLKGKHLRFQSVRLESLGKWVATKDAMVFVLPTEGRGRCLASGLTHHFTAGDLLVLNSRNACEIQADGALAFTTFSATPEQLFPLVCAGEISVLRTACDQFKAARLHKLDTALAKECHQLLHLEKATSILAERCRALRIVVAVLDAEPPVDQSKRSGFVRAEDHLAQVFENLSVEDIVDSSVEELATRFGWSKRHLNRIFHANFGLSVAAMKMELRLAKAVALLRDPDMKIIAVAEACGFNYLGLFNTCFKKRYGVTPSQCRKTLGEVEGNSEASRDHSQALRCPLRSMGLVCGRPNQQTQTTGHAANAHASDGSSPRLLITAIPTIEEVERKRMQSGKECDRTSHSLPSSGNAWNPQATTDCLETVA